MRDPERQRKIDAMALIMGGEGFHYVKEEIDEIVEGYHRAYRNASTQQERYRACDDAYRIAALWRDIKQKLKFIKEEATKPEETRDEVPTRDRRFER